jgi:hypothetical protein
MLNHAYDALLSHASLSYWLADTGPLPVLTLALLLASAGLLDREGQYFRWVVVSET